MYLHENVHVPIFYSAIDEPTMFCTFYIFFSCSNEYYSTVYPTQI